MPEQIPHAVVADVDLAPPEAPPAGHLPARILAGLAFLTVQMLFIPCAATVATVRQETDIWKWTGFSVGLLLVVSFAVAIGVYQLAVLVGA